MKIISAALLLVWMPLASAQTPTILDGVFSKAQAQRGKAVYKRHCSGCHSTNLQGEGIEPPLIDQLFIDAWREDKLFSLYDFMQVRMPKESRNSTPGSLAAQEYLDVLTYILDSNGYPSGANELTQEQLITTLFVGPNGQAPLPPSAMARFVGCLILSGTSYQLAQATEPTRVRVVDETDDREIAQSRALALGSNKITLNNVQQLPTADNAVTLSGKKVQAKGVVTSLGDHNFKLNVLSLVVTGGECAQL